MFKLNLETLELGYVPDAMETRGYSTLEYNHLEDLGALTLLALTSGDDAQLEELADLLASACPTPADLLLLNEGIIILEQQLWQRFDAAGRE